MRIEFKKPKDENFYVITETDPVCDARDVPIDGACWPGRIFEQLRISGGATLTLIENLGAIHTDSAYLSDGMLIATGAEARG